MLPKSAGRVCCVSFGLLMVWSLVSSGAGLAANDESAEEIVAD